MPSAAPPDGAPVAGVRPGARRCDGADCANSTGWAAIVADWEVFERAEDRSLRGPMGIVPRSLAAAGHQAEADARRLAEPWVPSSRVSMRSARLPCRTMIQFNHAFFLREVNERRARGIYTARWRSPTRWPGALLGYYARTTCDCGRGTRPWLSRLNATTRAHSRQPGQRPAGLAPGFPNRRPSSRTPGYRQERDRFHASKPILY